jgi:hypothetical protein
VSSSFAVWLRRLFSSHVCLEIFTALPELLNELVHRRFEAAIHLIDVDMLR